MMFANENKTNKIETGRAFLIIHTEYSGHIRKDLKLHRIIAQRPTPSPLPPPPPPKRNRADTSKAPLRITETETPSVVGHLA